MNERGCGYSISRFQGYKEWPSRCMCHAREDQKIGV
jgi:hypothetical protein